jgi:hypothetical protein
MVATIIIKLLATPLATNMKILFVRISYNCAWQDFLINEDYSTDAAFRVAQLEPKRSGSPVYTLNHFWPR